ncbi:hypothetical protein [Pseudoalteromonas luteoviolacea]|nr:hypothetical protein [Pseudoalteromonas luteoviolacea]
MILLCFIDFRITVMQLSIVDDGTVTGKTAGYHRSLFSELAF